MKTQPLNQEHGETCTLVFKDFLLPLKNSDQILDHLGEFGRSPVIIGNIKEAAQSQFVPRMEVQVTGKFSWPAKQFEGYLLGLGVANGEVLIERHEVAAIPTTL